MKELLEVHGDLEAMLYSSRSSRMNADTYRWCFLGGAPSPPPAPDPNVTSAAQTASNKETAGYQAGLNNVNQNTPLGNINYTYGTQNINGQTVPQTNSQITLDPTVQTALSQGLLSKAGEAGLANQYENQVANTMSRPYDLNSVGTAPTPDAAYQAKINANQNALEQPYIDRSNEQLRSSLANQGITQGSEAYKNAMLDQSNSLNNLQEQNIQNATQQEAQQFGLQQQAYQQQLQNYHQNYVMPLNQLSALQSGSQVSQPQFSSPSQTNVNPTNTAGITNQAYQNSLNGYNTSVAANNSQNNGLYSLGGSLASAAIFASDRRLKTNIKKIGETPHGIPVYTFKYKSGGGKQYGVMAQDVEKIIPQAVITNANGYKSVDYRMVR